MQPGDNQTGDDALKEASSTTRGTGIFSVPDPTSQDYMAHKKVVVPDITYQECIRRGAFCIAYKWVARILDPDDPAETECPKPPNGMLCAGSCANDLCLCVNGICV
ncbi:hypothetical protein [Microvirga tunisiensis]|uniref:Uncharacterized protein n=1 Tax=Microvirga tunisiensis TaxID=2108360 RepID=A0A5N7MGT4_9HYPH|nr:hypothetical protein [Microvirga tunisiensis]MPR06184.1 hypothetical protein [Microvirga tunisiensis]MPR26073.1 hypothetical protein [Microvirga tunisiensis]